jgi:hypothetical protein
VRSQPTLLHRNPTSEAGWQCRGFQARVGKLGPNGERQRDFFKHAGKKIDLTDQDQIIDRAGIGNEKQTGEATDKEYRSRPQLALEMIQVVARWLGSRKLRVLGDSEYAGGSISRHLPTNVELISRMTMNAALYEFQNRRKGGISVVVSDSQPAAGT